MHSPDHSTYPRRAAELIKLFLCPDSLKTDNQQLFFQLYLGVYESEVDAAKAHDRAARFHFAESAVCNFDSEHEADRQAEIHKQRQLVQQQQLAEDRAHHAELHGGSFSVGREEFDDLEEYHRGMDEATCSSEDGDGMGMDGEGCEPLHDNEQDDDGEMSEEGVDVDGDGGGGYEEDGLGRTSRSMSSYSSAMSTGSMSDGDSGAGAGGPNRGGGHSRSRSAGGGSSNSNSSSPRCEVTKAAAAAAAAAFAAAVAPTPAAAAGGNGSADMQVQQRSRCSSGESDCSSDFVPSSLMREVSQSSTQEGMGFPVAEDLLGYEMQSWYRCQDDDDRTPASSGESQFESSQLQQQQPFMGRQQQSEELWGTAVGANLGWGFGDFAQTYSDGGSRSSSGSMTSSNLSCDDDYLPSALPPLMGMSAGEA